MFSLFMVAESAEGQMPRPPCEPLIDVEVTTKTHRVVRGQLWCLYPDEVWLWAAVPDANGRQKRTMVVERLDDVLRIVERTPGTRRRVVGGAVTGALIGSIISDDKLPNLPFAAVFGTAAAYGELKSSRRPPRVIFESGP
jgi:hypothetical protein